MTTVWTMACVCGLPILLAAMGAGMTADGPMGGDFPALPEGDGLAAKHPGDAEIQENPAVVFADDFEDCAESTDLEKKWNYTVWNVQEQLITDAPENVHSGKKALQFALRQGGEVGGGAMTQFAESYDCLFVRYYLKFDEGADFYNSAHDGACLSALAPGYDPKRPLSAGTRADGHSKFLASLDTWRTRRMDPIPPAPGELIIYCYHPEQRGNYGDNFYPETKFYPETGRWYCCELMVKANTVGQRDGRLAFWMDGKLIGDFTGLRLRDVDTLKINFLSMGFYIGRNRIKDNTIWYDDVVVATSYIGPMKQH